MPHSWRRYLPAIMIASTLALTVAGMAFLTVPASGAPQTTALADAAVSRQAPSFASAPAVSKSPLREAQHAQWLAASEHAFHLSHLSHLRLLAARRAQALAAERAAAYARAHPVRLVPASSPQAGSGGGSAAPAPVAAPGCSDPSGQLDAAQVAMLWNCAGGPASQDGSAVAIATCESGMNTGAYNPSGATGLFQILGSVVPGNLYDGHVNALNAVAKYEASGGWGQWVCQPGAATAAYVTSSRIPAAPVAPSGTARAIAYATAQLGCPYHYGGTGPCRAGFDCSGLVMMAWRAGGISLERTTYEMWASLRHVSRSALAPGDLVFSNGFGHVMLYIGGGYVIQAPHTGAYVEKTPLAYVGAIGYALP